MSDNLCFFNAVTHSVTHFISQIECCLRYRTCQACEIPIPLGHALYIAGVLRFLLHAGLLSYESSSPMYNCSWNSKCTKTYKHNSGSFWKLLLASKYRHHCDSILGLRPVLSLTHLQRIANDFECTGCSCATNVYSLQQISTSIHDASLKEPCS